MTQTWDYVVVGAGSAGAVMAARLSEDPAASVLMVAERMATRMMAPAASPV